MGGKSNGSFAGIPRHVMRHRDYVSLSSSAIRLLLEFSFQYRGSNNGDLVAAWHVLRHRGFNSKATIAKALDELLRARMIERTREGRFMNPGGVCALYALTWQPIDDCPGKQLDKKPTITPARTFRDD